MTFRFDNQVALITGATRGIGKEIADTLHALGASVLITGTNAAQLEYLQKLSDQNGERKRYYCVDFSKQQQLDDFIKEMARIDKIDILVNNAGINKLNFVNEALTEDWNEMLSVNLTTPFLLIRAVSHKMKKYEYGRIVNIASIFSTISKERRSVYSATKFGLHGLTVGVSNDLARHNILVNTVSPGFVLTDLTRKNLSESEIGQLTNQIPARRMGCTEDIARVVTFLVSEWNSYLTGQNIIVDGGFVNV